MKIRIFALAKELGLDSKELIDLCATAGIQLKNSALASISPEEKDVVLGLLKKGSGASARKPTDSAPLAPIRDDVPDVAGKHRDIRTMAPRTAASRPVRHELQPAETGTAVAELESPVLPEEPTPVEEATAPPSEPVIPEAPAPLTVAEAAPSAPPMPSAPPEPSIEESPATPAQPETPQQPLAAVSTPMDGPPPPPASQPPASPPAASPRPARPASAPAATTPPAPVKPVQAAPLRREDYINVAGTAHRRTFDMVPRGSVSQDPETRRKKSEKSLPSFAAPPEYKAPKPKTTKPEEAPAQKPEFRINSEMLRQQGPLSQQVTTRGDRSKIKDPKTGKPRTLVDELAELMEQSKRAGKPGVATPEGKPGLRRADAGRRRSGGKVGAEDDDGPRRSAMRGPKRKKGPVALKSTAEIELPITIRSLSEAIGRPAKDLIKILFQRGQMVTINQSLTEDEAIELALELGVDLTILRGRDIEAELAAMLEDGDDPEELLVTRPPIVTILGHVDHGKTTLLDKLRSANVASGEAGGITQHIASYQVTHNGQKLTFVDTPGHAAFGEMRARGANVTDIVVLVVAADDGVMPQTVECISHARNAGVPIVVAMNKIDLPAANPQRVLQQLAANDVLPHEWGGDVEVVRTSGATGEGLDNLLETLLLTSELNGLKANPERQAVGICLEAFRDEGRGTVAWLVVQKGTLHVGDVVLCGQSYGRIRAMYDDRDREVDEAPPSTPIKVAGLDIMPSAGAHFFVLDDLEEARQIAEERREKGRADVLTGRRKPRTLDDILEAARGGSVQDLPLILKVDTPGSLEALRHEIGKIDHPEVRVQIVHEGVGGVNESDVALASASGAIVIAFHVIPEDRAQAQAEREGIDIRRYDIIYEVTDHIKKSLEGLLIPEKKQVSTGRAIVLQTFHISRIGTVAGCRVLSGTIERSNRVQLIRDQKILNDYAIASLKREKDDAREVREGFECGIRLEGFNDIKEGDMLQAYKVEEVKRTLESSSSK